MGLRHQISLRPFAALMGTMAIVALWSHPSAAQEIKINMGPGGASFAPKPNPMQASPATVAINPATQTATIKITNTSDDTSYGRVRLQFGLPHPPGRIAHDPLAAGLVAADSAKADSIRRDSLRTDSLEKIWSLAKWLTETPTDVAIPPHGTVTVTLHFKAPASLPPGEYSAYAAVRKMTPMTMSFNMSMSGAGGQSMGAQKSQATGWSQTPDIFMAPALVKLTYQAR